MNKVKISQAPSPNLIVSGDSGERLAVPSQPMELAVDHYLNTIFNRKIIIQLIWPGRPNNPLLIHALAALRLRGKPRASGLRGLFYPSRISTSYSLNNYHIESRQLLQGARKAANRGDRSPWTIVLIRLRDLFEKADISEAGSGCRHPTLGDIVLSFRPVPGLEDVWPNVCDRMFRELRHDTGFIKYNRNIKKNLSEMGAPEKAKYAVFHLPHSTDLVAIKSLLSAKVLVANQPQMLLIDATRQSAAACAINIRTYIPKVIKAACEVFGPRFPGFYVVTDNPVMASNLQKDLQKQVLKWKNADGKKTGIKVQKSTIDWPYKDNGFGKPFSLSLHRTLKRHKIRVEGISIGRLHKRIYNLCRHLRNHTLNDALRKLQETNRFLRRASTLPCSKFELNEWLLNSDLSDEAMESYGRSFIWKTHAVALQRIFTETEAAVVLPKVRALMNEIERLLEALETGTPMAKAICEEVQWALESTNGQIVIVFPKWYHAMLAERFMQAKGLVEDVGTDRVSYLYGKISDALLEDQNIGAIILACNPDEHLELFLSRDFTDRLETVLIFDVEGAKKGSRLIEMVLNETHLAAYHHRAEAIKRELDKIPHDLLKFPVIGDLNRAFKLSDSTYREKEPIRKKGDQVVLRFTDRGPFVCGLESKFRVYDPESWNVPKFIIKNAKDLSAGDQVFLMPDDLRSEIEMLLRSGGTQSVQNDLLDEYHKEIERLAAGIPGNKASVARLVFDRMCTIDPTMAARENVNNVLRWLNVEKLKDIPVEKRKPQAPRQYRHFRVFAKAIGIEDIMASTYWHSSICIIRKDRIEEGREAGEFFTSLLFDETIAKMRSGITKAQIEALHSQAIDNLYQILQVEH